MSATEWPRKKSIHLWGKNRSDPYLLTHRCNHSRGIANPDRSCRGFVFGSVPNIVDHTTGVIQTVASKRISEKQIDALIKELNTLTYNLWWSWNPDAQRIFNELSPFFWEHSNHNPVEVMRWISGAELRGRLQDPDFFKRVDTVCTRFRDYMGAKNVWAKKHAAGLKEGPVAYFSAEFGMHECLRIYSGGLGILSGDHVKSASDLGIPFVGVGLLYHQGYFQQQISQDGWQQELYPAYDPAKLPITPVVDKKGSPVECSVEIGSSSVRYRAWSVQVGRIKVYLLDSNLPANEDQFRNLTMHVYGGDHSNRIGQEILLGIGGVRMLRALGIVPSVYHMNEGHSGFLTLELLRETLATKRDLAKAIPAVKEQCVFTTHTPVPAGHDRFDRALMEWALGSFVSSLGLSMDQFLGFGRINIADQNETFCLTVLALKMSRSANGVSWLNGKVSREMWQQLYPGLPVEDVPIGSITNGIHMTGWCKPSAMQFWRSSAGPKWVEKLQDPQACAKLLRSNTISDKELWAMRTALRRELVEFVRRRLREQHLRHGGDGLGMFDDVLSPDALTIGFARRFATYKRAPLFFQDIEWAIHMLTRTGFPIQIVFAGKAHPRDDAGKHFIQQIVNISRRVDLFGKVVFIENYDINVARHMIAGCDLWLNTPRRPMEACGTSGQKVLIHGGLNASTMDGWWREAYNGKNGWNIGEDTTANTEHMQDEHDAASLRTIMEKEAIPLFYDRGKDGIPHKWLARVRESMTTLIPVYNTDRMVAEYTTKYYLTRK